MTSAATYARSCRDITITVGQRVNARRRTVGTRDSPVLLLGCLFIRIAG